jgi:hypothetical protein
LLASDHAKLQFYSPAHLSGTESIPKFLDSPPKSEHTILGETSALLLETALLETTSTTLLSFYKIVGIHIGEEWKGVELKLR